MLLFPFCYYLITVQKCGLWMGWNYRLLPTCGRFIGKEGEVVIQKKPKGDY